MDIERPTPKRGLRTVLNALVGMLLLCIVLALIVVFQTVGATAEMRKEAREAVLLAEMDTAVQGVAIEVDAWISGEIDETVDGHPVLDSELVQGHLVDFESAGASLSAIIKEEELHLIAEMFGMFGNYQEELMTLHTESPEDVDRLLAYNSNVQPIERAFRTALLELQNEEISHLEESVSTVRGAEGLLRWLLPGLLVLVLALMAAIRRLSRRLREAAEADTLHRSRTAFIATVSHELRTPLTAVVGMAYEMRDSLQTLSESEVEEFAGVIASESTEVASIVEDLLVAARYEAGNLAVVRERVDLQQQVDQVLRSGHIPEGHTVTTVSDGSTAAAADGARVRQILRNILTNAATYGGEQIEIGIDGTDDRARMWVKDNGPGVPAHDRHRIFDPYERAHEAPGVPASVGLGLTVSRQLARSMGGDLRYRYDGGSMFELLLPVHEAAPSRA